MKEIKDYLHLYLGCECMIDTVIDKGHRTHIIGIHTNGNIQVAHAAGTQDKWEAKYIKLILRELSDMTEEEKKTVFGSYGELGIHDAYDNYFKPEGVRFMLSKHFDLFGLIEAGLAIDKTTLNK